MREILFRGKTSDGEWICGHLLEQNIPDCRSYIVMSIIAEMDNRHIEIMDFDINEVIPETVGQFTGLTDKNGVKIFEGDIVRAFTRFSEIYVSSVTYHEGTFWFKNWSWTKFLFKFEKIEVIGNIHDNPEILKTPSP